MIKLMNRSCSASGCAQLVYTENFVLLNEICRNLLGWNCFNVYDGRDECAVGAFAVYLELLALNVNWERERINVCIVLCYILLYVLLGAFASNLPNHFWSFMGSLLCRSLWSGLSTWFVCGKWMLSVFGISFLVSACLHWSSTGCGETPFRAGNDDLNGFESWKQR